MNFHFTGSSLSCFNAFGSVVSWLRFPQLDHSFLAFGRSSHRRWALPLDIWCIQDGPHRPRLKGRATQHFSCDSWLDGCCTVCDGWAVHLVRPLFQVPSRQVRRHPIEPQDADESGFALPERIWIRNRGCAVARPRRLILWCHHLDIISHSHLHMCVHSHSHLLAHVM